MVYSRVIKTLDIRSKISLVPKKFFQSEIDDESLDQKIYKPILRNILYHCKPVLFPLLYARYYFIVTRRFDISAIKADISLTAFKQCAIYLNSYYRIHLSSFSVPIEFLLVDLH